MRKSLQVLQLKTASFKPPLTNDSMYFPVVTEGRPLGRHWV